MENWEKEVRKFWDQTADSEWYRSLRTDERLEKIRKDPASAFHPAVFPVLKKMLGGFEGKRILLPSSGDNHAAFALSLLGARVTSADISEKQLENAAELAEKMGLDIEFVQDDTMKLSKIGDSIYDMVYTSNGTLTWIGDLKGMYGNVARVLKDGGISAMYDIHPFNRPFTGEPWKEPAVKKSYDDVMPDLHWRVADIVNANISAGLQIAEMKELQAVEPSFWYAYDELKTKTAEDLKGIDDWKVNPMAALPSWLFLVSKTI